MKIRFQKTTPTVIYMSQVKKSGYGIYIAVHAWLVKGNRLRMLADVQLSWGDSTAHVQRLFLPI